MKLIDNRGTNDSIKLSELNDGEALEFEDHEGIKTGMKVGRLNDCGLKFHLVFQFDNKHLNKFSGDVIVKPLDMEITISDKTNIKINEDDPCFIIDGHKLKVDDFKSTGIKIVEPNGTVCNVRKGEHLPKFISNKLNKNDNIRARLSELLSKYEIDMWSEGDDYYIE